MLYIKIDLSTIHENLIKFILNKLKNIFYMKMRKEFAKEYASNKSYLV